MGMDSLSKRYVSIDLSTSNDRLASDIDYVVLDNYVTNYIKQSKADYAIGGYLEHRNLYATSAHFDQEGKRDIHLGIDIWTKANHPIYAPLDGIIHSFAYNDQPLDYGYTLIIEHQYHTHRFYTLYGHLSAQHYQSWFVGQRINNGDIIATLGDKLENGGWPPHLHFQVIMDMSDWSGDYPGVCHTKELQYYKNNCPNPLTLIHKKKHLPLK